MFQSETQGATVVVAEGSTQEGALHVSVDQGSRDEGIGGRPTGQQGRMADERHSQSNQSTHRSNSSDDA